MTTDGDATFERDLRSALHSASALPLGAVDPVAARRAAGSRARTRTAITTSLASSLIIFAGAGAIYDAAHRSRPATLGSDDRVVTGRHRVATSPSPRASTVLPIVASFRPGPPVAGRSATLVVAYHGRGPADVTVTWGDGTPTQVLADAACMDSGAVAGDSRVTAAHVYAAVGDYTISVSESNGCSPAVTTSLRQHVAAPTAG